MIKIQNIYYMLSYAFKVLKEQGYEKCLVEDFENTAELLSAILVKGINSQIKKGLRKEYLEVQEPLSCLRGKINVSDSIKTQSLMKQQLVCRYDEFSINTYLNQIIKTTLLVLLKNDISKTRKKEIRNTLLYLGDIDVLDIHRINWSLHYNKNNQTYQMLINVCYLILKGLLSQEQKGNVNLQKYLDEQRMSRLYEKFILEYYRKEHPELNVSSSQITWQLDEGSSSLFLPAMQSDIMLSKGHKTLIIDAKYYARTMQTNFDRNTLHSGNLYQIFTYVKNKDTQLKKNATTECVVAGILLYAKTDEAITLDNDFQMSGNRISVKTLDLNFPFIEIAKQLDALADQFFTL